MKINEHLNIYLAAGEKKYYPLDDNLTQPLLEDINWLITNGGIDITEEAVKIEAGHLNWSEGYINYSCEGASIAIEAVVKIEDDCTEGSHWLILELPNLRLLGEMTKTKPMFVSWQRAQPAINSCDIPIKEFQVHATAEEAGRAALFHTLKIVSIIVGCIVGLIFFRTILD